ncbi:glycine cleavage system aminomethyltransferase GcvT [candidate division CSSED10-310 bacterium]|uniref:Aminomethyltransferase n=1 Tax=candidate division CSSED10-310 bacterium TaxID=2855610 RepID=A0ABV6Z2N9_UNCC1
MTANTPRENKKTPLYESHVELGAKMIPFAGWIMPIQYAGITKEHKTVRSQAGLFDVSHMGEIELRGPDALNNVQKLVTNNVGRLTEGGALYTGMLYPNGTFVDDLLVYRLADDRYLLVVNAANTEKDFQWVQDNLSGNVSAENISDTICQLALQGPKSFDIFSKICPEPVRDLKPFTFLQGTIGGCKTIISRTGYTGEDGLELYLAWDDGLTVWQALLEAGQTTGLEAVGLGARDTLRMEAGLMLYGNDISAETTPLEAGLKWTVKFKKGDFIGRDALLEQKHAGLQRKLAGFRMRGKGIPRPSYPVFVQGQKMGEVASGGLAIWLKQRVGTTYLPPEFVEPGTSIEIDIRNKAVEAEIVTLPFYKRPEL